MNLQEKEQIVASLGEKFRSSQASFFVSYHGCSCEELTGLRRSLQPVGAEFRVVKNTLAERAVEGVDERSLAQVLSGPTAVVWSRTDPVASAKVVTAFAKEADTFAIKGGIVDGQLVGAREVEMLATMPGKAELFAQLLGLINGPAVKLLQTMQAPASHVVRLFQAWKEKQEQSS